MVYLSIEEFNPGGDNIADVMVSVEDSDGLFRWATDAAHVVMNTDATSVKIPETRLPAMPPMKEPEVVVSGTFVCAAVR